MQARGQDFISEARQLVDATCVDDIENNQICGFYRTSDRTVEEMITICLWDEEREKYRSLCKRRSLAASVGKNYQFASCGCCSGDTFHSNRRLRKDEGDRPFCKYPEPVCGGDPSCPSRFKARANSRIYYHNGTKVVSECVDPFSPIQVAGDFTCGTDVVSAGRESGGNTLKVLGNNGSPPEAFPLGLCQGDCDSDAECKDGLVCMQRKADEKIPGCKGNAAKGLDYCVGPPELKEVGHNGYPPEMYPLGLCEGDCDGDDDCAEGLVCMQREGNEPILGCGGDAESKIDYCVSPTVTTLTVLKPTSAPVAKKPNLEYKGASGIPQDAFPLGLCEGTCNSNDECEGDLICLQRRDDEAVPGCEGDGVSGANYCVKSLNEKAPSPTQKPTPKPTGKPTPNPTPRSPTGSNKLADIGKDPGYPLGMCEGDCDSDQHCAGGLKCFMRDEYEPVPGCWGRGYKGRDYCTDPSLPILTEKPTARPTQAPQGTGLYDPNYRFKLRLYWHPSFFWQETHDEAWWCMECTKCKGYSLNNGKDAYCQIPGKTGASCEAGMHLWIMECQDDRDFQFNVLKNSGSGDQIRVHGTNLCLQTVENTNPFQPFYDASQDYITRLKDRSDAYDHTMFLELQRCDNRKSRQLFMPIQSLKKFELRPYNQRDWSDKEAYCVTNRHHPKRAEVVGLFQCRMSKGDTTGWWEEYHK